MCFKKNQVVSKSYKIYIYRSEQKYFAFIFIYSEVNLHLQICCDGTGIQSSA